MKRDKSYFLVFLVVICAAVVFGDYVTYVKTKDNKFEPGEYLQSLSRLFSFYLVIV